MFSCLLLAAISAAPETRDAGVTYKYGECDGCVNYAKLKEQLLLGDAIDRAVTITLYADIEFAEDLKLKSNLVFEPDDPKNIRVVHWIFGSADMNLMNSGSVTFEKVKVSPVVAPGSTTATLYGKSVTINGDLIIPDGISSLKGKFESIKSNTNAILSFDEITYSSLEYEITEWPTKNIVFNSRTYSYTGISIKDIDFEIEIRSEHIILKRENSPSITFNAKMNVYKVKPRPEIDMKIDNCDLKIYQTEFIDYLIIRIKELKNSNVTLIGQKITSFDVFSDIDHKKVSNSTIYVSTDLPNAFYKYISYVILTKSVRFMHIDITKSDIKIPKLDGVQITIGLHSLYIYRAVTIDSSIKFETEGLTIFSSISDTVNANIIVSDEILLTNTENVTLDKIEIGDNCLITVNGVGTITVNNLVLNTNPKVFYYKGEVNEIAKEISDAGLEKLNNILCSNSEIKAPTQVFLNYYAADKIFLSKNDIFDIELDDTKKCFGVKFHKLISSEVNIYVGGTETIENFGDYNVQSLNSKEWNVQNNMPIESLQITLKKEVEGELNLDSLELDDECYLSVEGTESAKKIKLALSQNALSKIRNINLEQIEILNTTQITSKFEELDLSSAILSEQAMNNINYDQIERVSIFENQIPQYKQILGKIKRLYVSIEECDEIRFKESTVELKKTGTQPRELEIDPNTEAVFLMLGNPITLTHESGSKLKNVHISNYDNEVTLGDDWSDVPDLIPIHPESRYKCDITKSPTIKLLYDENNNQDYIPVLTSSTNEKINNYIVYKDNSMNNDEISFDISMEIDQSNSNKIREIKLNDLNFKTKIRPVGSSIKPKILVDNIIIPKTSEKDIKQELMVAYDFYGFLNYPDDFMRAMIQSRKASNLEINYVKKLTISSSTNLAIETADSKADEIEFKIYAESVMPVAKINLKNANETQFSFTSVWSDVEINDFSKKFLNKEFAVATILTKRCEDLKPFIINNGKAPITVRCVNEDTGSGYYFDNAVIYAKIEYNEESQKLSGGEIAGIVVGSIAGVAIIVVIVLFATGVIACSKKEADTEGVNERGAAEMQII